jgi:hypothetical protein
MYLSVTTYYNLVKILKKKKSISHLISTDMANTKFIKQSANFRTMSFSLSPPIEILFWLLIKSCYMAPWALLHVLSEVHGSSSMLGTQLCLPACSHHMEWYDNRDHISYLLIHQILMEGSQCVGYYPKCGGDKKEWQTPLFTLLFPMFFLIYHILIWGDFIVITPYLCKV